MVEASLLSAALCGLAAGSPVALSPYKPDDWTLHLWHLDESRAPFPDQVGATPMLGLLNHAQASQPSFAGLRSSISFMHDAGGSLEGGRLKGAVLLAAPALADGNADNVAASFRFTGATGAFTIEAMVRFDKLPTESQNVASSIVSMDGENTNRVFNLRVDQAGFLAFIPLSGTIEGGGALAAIPLEGAHGINTKDWFHVAVTYDGNDGLPNNLRLYWTRLDVLHEEAHLIGSGTLAEDFSKLVADFAIGNEARTQWGNAEAEPFSGCIDEVRISSVARHPSDFLFVPEEKRIHPGMPGDSLNEDRVPEVRLAAMLVDGKPVPLPASGQLPVLPPGPHRLDFDFGVGADSLSRAVRIRSRLKGVDERWNESGRGMAVTCEVLDADGVEISSAQFPVLGASQGWQTSIDDSDLRQRSEPLFVPAAGKFVRIHISSGAEDTTGVLGIDDLKLVMRSRDEVAVQVWNNSGFGEGERLQLPDGRPIGWNRGGGSPAIARIYNLSNNPMLALVDGDQGSYGNWSCTQPLPMIPRKGATMLLQWREVFNVIGGGDRRATFLNVPPGDYSFEAIASTTGESPRGSYFVQRFSIQAQFWSRPWFWALTAACVVGSMAVGTVAVLRQRASRKLDRLRVQNALAKDRARIARDMHDDLGTRITMLTMNAALTKREMHRNPEVADRHLDNLSSSARDLVAAMDGLVWAVDPSNDSLDHLGERLVSLGQEIFQDSEFHCDIDIPHVLPEKALTSEVRHHLFLAVKEGLHNVLRHAGPCRVSLQLDASGDRLKITIEDQGKGFDTRSPDLGNGLNNLSHRLASVGGTCQITSVVGHGTCVVLTCPL